MKLGFGRGSRKGSMETTRSLLFSAWRLFGWIVDVELERDRVGGGGERDEELDLLRLCRG